MVVPLKCWQRLFHPLVLDRPLSDRAEADRHLCEPQLAAKGIVKCGGSIGQLFAHVRGLACVVVVADVLNFVRVAALDDAAVAQEMC